MNRPSLIFILCILMLGACATRPPGIGSPVEWSSLQNWTSDNHSEVWQGFLKSCQKLKQEHWQEVCNLAQNSPDLNDAEARQFFETHFEVRPVYAEGGESLGLITGYYEPLLKGSRKSSGRYRFPLYTAPKELLIVDLGKVYPKLKSLRLRGRLEGRRIVPYYSRAEIEGDPSHLQGYELLWVEDAVELFFLQIQGSGRIEMANGEIVRVGYQDQNGHPYLSIGKLLVERGELSLDKASMQGIKAWGIRNPEKLNELLHQNPSYVFFRELPAGISGPIGALGVSLTAGRSLAIDPRVIPQGAPVFLSTTWPNSSKKLHRLMIAQDTGGAIKGGVRADFFWGFGKEAANQAGKMKQIGKIWVRMPNSYVQQAQIP